MCSVRPAWQTPSWQAAGLAAGWVLCDNWTRPPACTTACVSVVVVRHSCCGCRTGCCAEYTSGDSQAFAGASAPSGVVCLSAAPLISRVYYTTHVCSKACVLVCLAKPAFFGIEVHLFLSAPSLPPPQAPRWSRPSRGQHRPWRSCKALQQTTPLGTPWWLLFWSPHGWAHPSIAISFSTPSLDLREWLFLWPWWDACLWLGVPRGCSGYLCAFYVAHLA